MKLRYLVPLLVFLCAFNYFMGYRLGKTTAARWYAQHPITSEMGVCVPGSIYTDKSTNETFFCVEPSVHVIEPEKWRAPAPVASVEEPR